MFKRPVTAELALRFGQLQNAHDLAKAIGRCIERLAAVGAR